MFRLLKIFSCRSSSASDVLRDEAEEEETNHNEIDNIIYQTKINKSIIQSPISPKNFTAIINERYLCQIERERIKPFTVSNIIAFINEIEQSNKGNLIFQTENIKLYVQISGSPLYPDTYYGKTVYSFPKNIIREQSNELHYQNKLMITKDVLASLVLILNI